jgi:hypothetical protein
LQEKIVGKDLAVHLIVMVLNMIEVLIHPDIDERYNCPEMSDLFPRSSKSDHFYVGIFFQKAIVLSK